MPTDSTLSLTETVNAATLKKPGFVCLKGQPCKILELNQKPKATVKGNDRLHIVGTHIFTGKKYEDTVNLTAGNDCWVEVPVISKKEFIVLDVDEDAKTVCVLIDESTGETMEHSIAEEGEEIGGDSAKKGDTNRGGELTEIGKKLVARFNANVESSDVGESAFKVSILTVMGRELLTDVVG